MGPPLGTIWLSRGFGKLCQSDRRDKKQLLLLMVRKLPLADTAIDAEITEDKHHITLLQGRALFSVASDPKLSFTVNAVGARIRVVGTVFEVLTKPSGVDVNVGEAIVDVSAVDKSRRVRLGKGQKVTVSQVGDLSKVEPFDVSAMAAWRQGRLIYIRARLGDVVAEVNRCRKIKIRLANKRVADIRLSMTLDKDKTDQLLSALVMTEPVAISRSVQSVIIYETYSRRTQ